MKSTRRSFLHNSVLSAAAVAWRFQRVPSLRKKPPFKKNYDGIKLVFPPIRFGSLMAQKKIRPLKIALKKQPKWGSTESNFY